MLFAEKPFKNKNSLAVHKNRFHKDEVSQCKTPLIRISTDNTSQIENIEYQTSTSQEPVNIQHDKSFLNYEKILQELDMLKEIINILKIVLKIYENVLLEKSEG